MGRLNSACSLPSQGEVEQKQGQEGPDAGVPGHSGAEGWSWTRLCSAQLESEGLARRINREMEIDQVGEAQEEIGGEVKESEVCETEARSKGRDRGT
jgi:hypothetical protein